MVHFWLRHEVKAGEKRTPLLPHQAKVLLDSGFQISVERSNTRCFPDSEYEKAGCRMVESGSWTQAPKDAVILGLKELPEVNDPLVHEHIFFAHCYKNQAGWKDILQRFIKGKGKLYDMEFLTDETGRRVAAFGFSAGFIGMAVGIKQWCVQQFDPQASLGALRYYDSNEDLIEDVKADLQKVKEKLNRDIPSVLVMGALGRSGRGSVTLAEKVGIKKILKWDMEETKNGGPFEEILDVDIFVNCIYLSKPIPPFITKELVDRTSRKMSVMVDVSCDTSNPNNPVPIYNESTTFFKPVLKCKKDAAVPLDVIAIDHLPSLVPSASSAEYTDALFPHLQQFPNSPVWDRAIKLFEEKSELAQRD